METRRERVERRLRHYSWRGKAVDVARRRLLVFECAWCPPTALVEILTEAGGVWILGGLVAVERAVGGDQEFIEILSVEGIERDAGADGERRVFGLIAKAVGNALSDEERGLGVRFRKDENEFVATVAGSDVNFT